MAMAAVISGSRCAGG